MGFPRFETSAKRSRPGLEEGDTSYGVAGVRAQLQATAQDSRLGKIHCVFGVGGAKLLPPQLLGGNNNMMGMFDCCGKRHDGHHEQVGA